MKYWIAESSYIICLLTFLAFVLPCRFKLRASVCWLVALLICYSKFHFFREIGGDVFVPALPEIIIWSWNFLYTGALALLILSVATLPFRFRWKGLVLPLIAAAVSAWGVWNGVRPPVMRQIVLKRSDIPPELDGYRIAHITDLHVSSAARGWRTRKVVEMVNAAKPNVICITGDMMDGGPDKCRDFIEPLSGLRAPDGVYASTGNHEFYYPLENWIGLYASWGIRFLRNECVILKGSLALGGVEDKARGTKCREPKIPPDIAGVFVSATNAEFRVLMEHRPENAFSNALQHGVDFQISGHTHGGVMPVLSSLVACHNNGFVRGEYDLPCGAKLYVSPGAGQWAGFLVRYFNPSEITVFVLSSQAR